MRFERMSGLTEEQLDELECRVAGLVEEPWDKGEGRPRELTLRECAECTHFSSPLGTSGSGARSILGSGTRSILPG